MKCAEMSIAIGTPGCVLHLIWDGALATDQVRLYFVLDEADEMLEGFQDELHEIFCYLPAAAQVALFSATLLACALPSAHRMSCSAPNWVPPTNAWMPTPMWLASEAQTL